MKVSDCRWTNERKRKKMRARVYMCARARVRMHLLTQSSVLTEGILSFPFSKISRVARMRMRERERDTIFTCARWYPFLRKPTMGKMCDDDALGYCPLETQEGTLYGASAAAENLKKKKKSNFDDVVSRRRDDGTRNNFGKENRRREGKGEGSRYTFPSGSSKASYLRRPRPVARRE